MQALLDWIEMFRNFLAIKRKREGDRCPNRLCQRSVDFVVRLQVG